MTSTQTTHVHASVRDRMMVAAVAAIVLLSGLIGAPASSVLGASLADFPEPFHFLEPLGSESGDPARFDATLLDELVVDICRVEASTCTPMKTLTSQSSLSERLRIESTSGAASYYLANWDTQKIKLSPHTYRVSVIVAGLELGSLDVAPAQYKSFGRTWPIKFRIENDPTIRVRILRSLDLSASQVASRIVLEFELGPDDVAELLAGDIDPYSDEEIELALAGVFQTTVIPETTKIADPATQSALTSFDPATGVMTFATTTATVNALKVGDVLVGEPNVAAPTGYLRYVIAITKPKKGPIVVETRQAMINEAVQVGTLDAAAELEPDDLLRVEAELPGVTFSEQGEQPMLATAAFGALDIGDGYNFHESIDVTLDGAAAQGGVSGSGTVHITGEMSFNAGWNVGFGVETCIDPPFFVCVDRFEAHTGIDLASDIKVTGDFEGHLTRETVLSTHYFKPIVFFIGPVPVVLVPIVKAIAGVEGNAYLDFTFEAQVESHLQLGAKWTDPDDGGSDWEDKSSISTPTGTADGDLQASMELRAYAKAEAKLLLYGIAGPGFAGRLGVRANVQYPRNPLWELWGYASAEVTFSVDLGGIIELSHWSKSLPEAEFRAAYSENARPVCSARTDRIPVALDEDVYLGPRVEPISEGYFACSDPEGEVVKYTSPFASGPVDSVTGRWSAPGDHDVEITATDASGLSRVFTLKVTVNNTPPILETATAAGTVPAGVQYFVNAAAWDVEDNSYLPCTSFAWTATGGTLAAAGDSRACAVVVVFDQLGSQTVKVVATDRHGKPSEASVTVNVTAAPANPAPVIDPSSFDIFAATGPLTICVQIDCDTSYNCVSRTDCRVPYGAILHNGADGDFRGPLTFSLGASDPNGDALQVTWYCTVGSASYPVTANGDGTFSCDPYSTSFTVPIEIHAEVSDGTTTVRSEVRRFQMYDRVA
jgi:hypothetical protein